MPKPTAWKTQKSAKIRTLGLISRLARALVIKLLISVAKTLEDLATERDFKRSWKISKICSKSYLKFFWSPPHFFHLYQWPFPLLHGVWASPLPHILDVLQLSRVSWLQQGIPKNHVQGSWCFVTVTYLISMNWNIFDFQKVNWLTIIWKQVNFMWTLEVLSSQT